MIISSPCTCSQAKRQSSVRPGLPPTLMVRASLCTCSHSKNPVSGHAFVMTSAETIYERPELAQNLLAECQGFG